MKTAAQLKATVRANKRAGGFVCKSIWIRPKDWPKAQKYLRKFQ